MGNNGKKYKYWSRLSYALFIRHWLNSRMWALAQASGYLINFKTYCKTPRTSEEPVASRPFRPDNATQKD